MRIFLQLTMVLTACLLLTGCPIVGTREIIGDKAVNAMPEKWNGHWVTDKSIITVQVENAEQGIITVYFIDNNEKKGPYKVYLKDVQGNIVANVKDESRGYYLWTIINVEKDFGYFTLLNMDKFKEMIREKKLPGEIVDSIPVLGKMTPEQRDITVKMVSHNPEYRQIVTYVRLEGLDRIAAAARKEIAKAKPTKHL